jgi:hypothetical protein
MDIAVCLKQVPHPDYMSKMALDPITKRLRREGVPLIINPVDRNAIELGIQLKERCLGKVAVLTMGPPQAREALEEALAMGADEAFLFCDPAFAGADTYATAYTLARAIDRLCPADLIVCGNGTIDSGTSQVGPQLAEFLDVPHVTNVGEICHVSDGQLLVKSVAEAEAHLASMQRFVRVLHAAVGLAAYFVADEAYQHKRYGILGQLVNQGRALANHQTRRIIQTIQRRALAQELNRGLSVSLPYFDDQALKLKTNPFVIIPAGIFLRFPGRVKLDAINNSHQHRLKRFPLFNRSAQYRV